MWACYIVGWMICGGWCKWKTKTNHREPEEGRKKQWKRLPIDRRPFVYSTANTIYFVFISHSTAYASNMHIPEYNKNRTTQYYRDIHIVRIFRVSFFLFLSFRSSVIFVLLSFKTTIKQRYWCDVERIILGWSALHGMVKKTTKVWLYIAKHIHHHLIECNK